MSPDVGLYIFITCIFSEVLGTKESITFLFKVTIELTASVGELEIPLTKMTSTPLGLNLGFSPNDLLQYAVGI